MKSLRTTGKSTVTSRGSQLKKQQQQLKAVKKQPAKTTEQFKVVKNCDSLENSSYYAVSEDQSMHLKPGATRSIQGSDKPNPTTFSNARTVSYIESVSSSQQELGKTLTNLKNSVLKPPGDMAKNFSATQKLASIGSQVLTSWQQSTQRNSAVPHSKQSTSDRPYTSELSKSGQTTTVVGGTSCNQSSVDNNNRLTVKNGVETSSIENSRLSCGEEANADMSQYVPKQLPRLLSQFVNSFKPFSSLQKESLPTLERILDEADKVKVPGIISEMTTQAGTFMSKATQNTVQGKAPLLETVRKDFGQRQFSPSRIKNKVVMSKIPHKILPTLSVADISSEGSIRFSHMNSSNSSGECSVPEIYTNSTVSIDNFARGQDYRGDSIESLGSKIFPVSNRDIEGPMVTHNSCLHASYNEGGSSSNGSSCRSSDLEGASGKCETCSCCRVNSNISNTLKSTLQSRFMINLETILHQEVKLWAILQLFKETKTHLIQEWPSQTLMVLCEEWWTITKDSACLFDLYKIYKDSATRKVLRKAMILEATLIVLAAFFNQILSSPLYCDEDTLDWLVKSQVKLFLMAHQNLLHIICLVLQRMGLENCDTNLWAVNLKDTVNQKIILTHQEALLMDEGPRNELLQKNNCGIVKAIRQVRKRTETRKTQQTQPFLFTSIEHIMSEVEKIHINKVKDILIQALSLETQQHLHITERNKQLIQNPTLGWQEYPLEELECEESIQLPPSPKERQLEQIPEEEENGEKQHNLSTINEDCSYYSANSPTAPPIVPPYLGPMPTHDNRRYTLVLDLDETLIHYVEPNIEGEHSEDNLGGQFLVRPGAHKFLREMSQYYEIVIFTAAMQDYADWVLDQLDFENCISHRLYRQHAIATDSFFIKDLSRIGRELHRTLIVDNVAENFQLQPDNGVFIRTWIDDPHDNALEELAPLLKEIVVKGVRDVREALHIFRMQMMEQVQRGILKPQLTLDYPENPEELEEPLQFRQIQNNHQAKLMLRK